MHIRIEDVVSLGEELGSALDASTDLWTWLPSYSVTQEHHGDHALNFRPKMRDVMREAAMYFAHLKRPLVEPTEEESDWFGRCACGNGCEGSEGGV